MRGAIDLFQKLWTTGIKEDENHTMKIKHLTDL